MSNSKELKTVTICREDLRITIRNNLDRVAQFMQVEDIITRETWREATDTKSSADNRAKELLKKWEEKVEEDTSFYTKVVEGHFRQNPEHYKSILSKLDKENRRQGGSPACRQQKLDEPVAKVHQSSSTTASSAAVAPNPNSGSKDKSLSTAQDLSRDAAEGATLISCREHGAEGKSLKEKIIGLEVEFSDMAENLLCHMKRNEVDLNMVTTWISTLPRYVNVYVSQLWKNIKDKHKYTDLNELFETLNMKIWNILDYNLLEYFIKKSKAHELEEKIKKYISELEKFKEATLVSEFIESWEGHNRDYPDFDKLYVKYKKHILTLADLDTFRKEVVQECIPSMLNYSSWIYYEHFQFGCFEVTWMLPIQLSVLVKRNLTNMYEVLERYKVLQVVIAGASVYPCKFSSKGRFYSAFDLSSTQGQLSKSRFYSALDLSSTQGQLSKSRFYSALDLSSNQGQLSKSRFYSALDLSSTQGQLSKIFSTQLSAEELAGWLHSHHNLPEGACKIIMDQSISGSVFVDLKKEDIDSLGFNFGASKILLKVLNQIKGEQPAQGARVASRTELDSEHYTELCRQLYSVRDQWEDIALALGFKDYEIKNIKRDLSLQYTGNQLYEVISFWLRWDLEDERGSKDIATLEALQKALNQTNNAKIKLKITMNFTK